MIKNNRGFLLGEETIKIILGIICVAALVVFIIYVYNGYSGNQDTRNAEATLNHLVTDIKGGSTQEQIYNPKNWILVSFSSSSNNLKDIPQVCTLNKWSNCLCICNDITSCNSRGSCVQSDFIVQGTPIKFDNLPLFLSINQQSKIISKSQ